MKAIIFLGPTLTLEEARKHLDAVYSPPVAQGDVLRALSHNPFVIGIIDGYFETVPAVWHKEILYAMERGVHVFGSASMGALRAAELEAFGMVGVGQIFRRYSSGELEDDDEVAVSHGPADMEYRALSEAMVNIRHIVETAENSGLISASLARRVLSVAKGLHFSERDSRRIVRILEPEIGCAQAETLQRLFKDTGSKLKELDAILMLQQVASLIRSGLEPKRISYKVEKTVFLDLMLSEVERDNAEHTAASLTDERQEFGASHLIRHETLLRIVARREATRLGFGCSGEEQREAIEAFSKAHRISSTAELLATLRQVGMELSSFEALMADAVLLEKLDRYYDRDLRANHADHLRLRAFRDVAATQKR
jgi:hypothetical protein